MKKALLTPTIALVIAVVAIAPRASAFCRGRCLPEDHSWGSGHG
jgi:hypothetical protein